MVLCFSKNAVDASGSEDKPRWKYSFESIRSSLFSQRQEPQESEWKVGGRYKVQASAAVFAAADMKVSSGLLEGKDEVLLLSVQTKGSKEIGHVLHMGPTVEESQSPGWIILQDTLLRRRLEGSWDIGGRYRVNHPATVRTKASLSSDIVCEVSPGEEVIIAFLSVGEDEDGRAHLRALVSSADSGLIGWVSPVAVSPESPIGDKFLDPVNLLGMEIVEAHRRSLVSGSIKNLSMRPTLSGRSLRSASTRSSLHSTDQGSPHVQQTSESGPRRSWTLGAKATWKVGGKYRVLEKLVVRELPELTSSAMGSIPAGALVTIADIHHAECAHLGWCPCALLAADEAGKHGAEGWVRCAAKDGHDLIDTRDQLEAEKILQQIGTPQQGDPALHKISGPSRCGTSGAAEGNTPEEVPKQSQDRQVSRCAPEGCHAWYPRLWLRVLAAAASFCTK